ncbi:MAG: hypothetical protein PHT76_12685, partial [Anaerostipes sp.]|nr:hypothetical protein [Anaerostipes sp.]
YYTELSKKDSASKIIQDVSLEQPEFYTLIDNEFKNLTSIGNDFRIRHHETNRINIVDSRHYEYLFNRCLSIISLALDFLI